MDGYENNNVVSDHIWDSLVQGSGEDIAEQARIEQKPISQIRVDQLTSTEHQTRQEYRIGEEVNIREWLEHTKSTQDQVTAKQEWNDQDNNIQNNRVPIAIISDSESQLDDEKTFTLRQQRKEIFSSVRRKSPRSLKKMINYKGMFVCFGKEAEVQHDFAIEIYKADSAYLNTLSLNGGGFKSTPATRALDKHKYVLVDHNYEDIHPLDFTSKV